MTDTDQENGMPRQVPASSTTPSPSPSSGVTGIAPRTYLCPAVLSFLSGILPLGVVAIRYALKAKEEWAADDALSQEDARRYSESAKSWSRAASGLAVPITAAGIIIIAYNLANGVDSKHVTGTITGLVVLAAMLLVASTGLVIAAQHRAVTTIIVGVIVVAVTAASVVIYRSTGLESFDFPGRAVALGGSDDDAWESVAVGTDGTVAVWGHFESRDGDFPYQATYGQTVTAFIDTNGKVLSYDVRDGGNGVVASPAGGFVSAGIRTVIKYSATGQTEWEAGLAYESVKAVGVAADGSIIALATNSTGRSASLQKLASDGTELWTDKGIPWPSGSSWLHLAMAPDGGCVIAGPVQDGGAFVTRYDANGNSEWSHEFSGRKYGPVYSVVVAPDGQILILYEAQNGSRLAALSGDGAESWSTDITTSRSPDAMAISADGQIVLVGKLSVNGHTQSAIMQYGPDGTPGAVTMIGNWPGILLNAVTASADGSIIAVGSTAVHRGPAHRTHAAKDALIVYL